MSIWSFKDKIGPGVSKNEAKAPAYIRFFKTFFTRFPTMVALNLLYLFCCLPIITIGAATAALNYVMRNYVRGVHVDPYHDFLRKCRECFKQGTAVTVLYIIVGVLVGYAISWYRSQYTTGGGFGFALLFGLMLLIVLLAAGSLPYLFPMMVSFDLPLRQLIRNSLILCTAKIFRTLGILLFSVVFLGAFAYFWQIGLIFLLLTNFSLVFLLNNFAVYPVLVKYIAKEDEKDDNTDNGDDEEQIFTDTVK